MKKVFLLLVLVSACVFIFSCNKQRAGNPVVLVFYKAAVYVHSSIPNGIAAIQKLGNENGFTVDTTNSADMFNEDSLKKYAAVIFLSTTGDVLNYRQEAAFERYIQSGGGFVGIHSATDTEYDWGWYGRLVGGYFNGHPKDQPAKYIIKDKSFAATSFFKDTVWQRTDEIYNFKKLNPDLHVLVTVDESSYQGGTNGVVHPMSWYHDYDGGRAFYTALGHVEASYTEDNYLKHLLGGIQYAMGKNNELDYAKAKTQLPPDADRFTKTQLSMGEFYEPTEMTILPNLDILIIQRRGEILLYKHDTKLIKQAGFFNVYCKTLHTPGVNAEEGMLGLAKDPNYAKNKWVYIYYSPADSSVNRLSRFTFTNDTLDKATEKVVLEVKSQREICCHTGGSIAFGPDKLLYFSAGDNSTPFDEKNQKYVNHGYAPLNDMPGHQQYDARRSAGNTNDLRGKIMRIRVKDDGTYEIPNGNLFPKGTEKARPEIYVMGDRNPYRITVDQKNSYLYWGEVGPDANNDSMETRGPRGYDEVNQARKAGYFGWPLFVGNNYPYHEYDYATGKSGAAFDPKHPVNNSRNNTGLRDLPPAQPAFIWYPYAASPDFPQVGTGGRNAMAGPVYYTDMYPAATRLPDYYNGKLIIYEWIRGWMKAVTMLPNGDFDKMEPFAEGMKVNSLIDMEAGPDGKLYLLEYGSGWFSKNPDAGLFCIDYNAGNRPPKIASVQVDNTTGVLPFAVKASAVVKDPENDKITYRWDLGNGITKETTTPELNYTYTRPGGYRISVEAKDSKGASSKSEGVPVYAGNARPEVAIRLTGGNKSFYMPGQPVSYAVAIQDKSDTSTINPSNLMVAVDYVEGYNREAVVGHHEGKAEIDGKSLMLSMDCKGCHKEKETSVGPAFLQVAQKYQKDPGAMSYLIDKIRKGGSGVWGEVAMPAHAALAITDGQQIVSWILSLGKATIKSMPQSGAVLPVAMQKPNSTMVLTASYTDNGGVNIDALTGSTTLALRSSTISFTGKEKLQGFTVAKVNNANVLMLPSGEGRFSIDSIDLTGVKAVNINAVWQQPVAGGLDFQIRLDAPDGKLLGGGTVLAPQQKQPTGTGHVLVDAVTDGKFHTVYFLYKPKDPGKKIMAGIASVQFNAK